MLGTTIDGRFKVLSLLGEGGLGTVYKCDQPELKRFAAVKLIHAAGLQDPENRARFEREARILAAISNKHIVSIYSFGMLPDSSPYMAMEYLDGRTLSEAIQAGPLPLQRCLNIGRQICDGLQAAHKAGIIHRDLKPQNIMLLQQPEPDFVKILDFGLSKLLPKSTAVEVQRLTQTGALIGSIHYMSPEICSGRAADARCDVYALGCILYECLTGEPPLTCDNPVGMLHKHRTELPQPLTRYSHLQSLPAEVELVIFKAMQKEASDRFQTMEELGSALELLCQGKSNEIKLDGVRVTQEQKKSNKKFIAAVTVGLVLIVGLLFAFKFRPNSAQESVSRKLSTRRGQARAHAAALLAEAAQSKAAHNTTRAVIYSERCLLALGRPWDGDLNREEALQDLELMRRLAEVSAGFKNNGKCKQQLVWLDSTNGKFMTEDPVDYLVCMSRLHRAFGSRERSAHDLKAAIITAQKQKRLDKANELIAEARGAAAGSDPIPEMGYYADLCQVRQCMLTNDTTSAIEAAPALVIQVDSIPDDSDFRVTELHELCGLMSELQLPEQAAQTLKKLETAMLTSCAASVKANPYFVHSDQATSQLSNNKKAVVMMGEIYNTMAPEHRDEALRSWAKVIQAIEDASKQRLYNWASNRVLGRNPTPAETSAILADHSIQGFSLKTMIRKLVASKEFTTKLNAVKKDQKVEFLFEHILGREIDPLGEAFFKEVIERPKVTMEEIVNIILVSAEFKRIVNERELPERAFQIRTLRWFSKSMLEKEADPITLSYAYTSDTDSWEPYKVAFSFSNQEPFRSKVKALKGKDRLEFLFKTFLGRGIDQVGLPFWTDFMKKHDEQTTIHGIIGSDEAKRYMRNVLQ